MGDLVNAEHHMRAMCTRRLQLCMLTTRQCTDLALYIHRVPEECPQDILDLYHACVHVHAALRPSALQAVNSMEKAVQVLPEASSFHGRSEVLPFALPILTFGSTPVVPLSCTCTFCPKMSSGLSMLALHFCASHTDFCTVASPDTHPGRHRGLSPYT